MHYFLVAVHDFAIGMPVVDDAYFSAIWGICAWAGQDRRWRHGVGGNLRSRVAYRSRCWSGSRGAAGQFFDLLVDHLPVPFKSDFIRGDAHHLEWADRLSRMDRLMRRFRGSAE